MASHQSDIPNTKHEKLCNMESSGAAVAGNDEIQLPRGNHVFPSDEFLADCLVKRFNGEPNPDHFHDVDLYSKHPAELSEELEPSTDNKWYIFTPRFKKTRDTKLRPDRRTPNGYWYTTGVDKAISVEGSTNPVALKNFLDFYEGNRPDSTKTEWKMHEYRLTDAVKNTLINSKPSGNFTLDNWVLCKLYKKREMSSRSEASTPTIVEAQNNEDKSSPPAGNMIIFF
ncbi:hypothetical protein J1N35_017775 [Gossypium stocksii]|uniref:NAC domain-containing protein n=1 Tax=Gossypium stocksii TaxID=47602 RepID=A0A9D4A616_9ROSI|nr:hypothetical protein J1N35_017775 [Gossypium stocksii]